MKKYFQAVGVDCYNQSITGDVAKTLNAASSDLDHTPCVVTFEPGIASRDGGHVYENISGTLRATPGDNQMTVAYDIGEARLRTPQEYIEKSPTITARCGTGGNNVPAVVFENHAQDSRYKGPLKVSQPVTATYGMGGNNQPLVICMATQQGGAEIMEDKCPTCVSVHGDIAGTLDASYYKGCGERNGVERDVVAVAYRANAYDELEQTEKGATLKACGGNYGGVLKIYVSREKGKQQK